jgi:hypothetical protein
MRAACEAGDTHLVGLARPLALEPDLPRRLLGDPLAASRARPVRFPVGALRGLAEMAWYGRQIRRLARGLEPDPSLSLGASILLRLASDLAASLRAR